MESNLHANQAFDSGDPTWRLSVELDLPYTPNFDQAPSFFLLMERIRGLGLCLKQIQRLREDITQSIHRAVQSGRSYIALLRQHIRKEDSILFPMADQVIPAEQHAQVWERFEKVVQAENSSGAHEKYAALAVRLEQEMAA